MLDFPAVILLSFVLALGFLLVILSCALWANWLPLLVGESLNLSWSPLFFSVSFWRLLTRPSSLDIRPRPTSQLDMLEMRPSR